MVYCSECRTAVGDATFCPECDTEISQSTKVTEFNETTEIEEDGLSYKRLIALVLMALLVGLLVAMAFSNVGGSGLLFLVTLGGVTYYLYDRKSSARNAIGSGLYIVALWLPITPIMFYFPMMGNVEEGAGQMIGSVLGMGQEGIVTLVAIFLGHFSGGDNLLIEEYDMEMDTNLVSGYQVGERGEQDM